MLCYSFSISIYGEKKRKRTVQDTDNCVRKPAPFVYVRFYFTLFFDGRCRTVFTTVVFFFLLNDLLEGLAVLADYVDALLESLCAVSNLNATDGEHLYVVVYVSLC